MVNKKTVIVLGAGASKEFGLPIGSELMDEIRSLLTIKSGYGSVNDELTNYALKVYSRNNGLATRELRSASTAIVEALPLAISIDNLIDAHRENKEIEICSKISIVRAILKAEKRSALYFDKSRDSGNSIFENSKETWLNLLFKIITENSTIESIDDRLSNFVFIVFNYDRCLEHFLYHAFQKYYNANSKSVKDLLNRSLNVHHVYGKVGELPWMEEKNSVHFGEEPDAYQLVELINEIKTFTENQNKEKDEIEIIHEHIQSAMNVIFLGFGYLELNLELLALDGEEHIDKISTQYYGTAYQISDSNTEQIISKLNKIGGLDTNRMYIHNDLTCFDLLNEYWRTFSLTDL